MSQKAHYIKKLGRYIYQHIDFGALTQYAALFLVSCLFSLPVTADTCVPPTGMSDSINITAPCDNLRVANGANTINIASTVTGTRGGYSNGAIEVVNSGRPVSLINIEPTGSATAGDSNGIFVSGRIATLSNSGTIFGTRDLGSIYITQNYFLGQTGTIHQLDNYGTIGSSTSNNPGIYMDTGSRIDNIFNLGTITGKAHDGSELGIHAPSSGTLGTLSNLQSGLKYNGNLPTNYNIIIYSPSQYGSLNVSNPQGTLTFGIHPNSVVSRTSNDTYSAVMTGLSSSNIANFSGTWTSGLSSVPWSLTNTPGSSTSWDLFTHPVVVTPTVTGSSSGTALATAMSSKLSKLTGWKFGPLVSSTIASASSSGTSTSSTTSGASTTLSNGTSLLDGLLNLTEPQVQQLAEVHAEGYSSNMMIGLEQMRFVTNIVLDRIHKPANNPNSTTMSYEVDQGRYVWMDAMAFSSTVDSNNNLAGYGSVATNITFGVDLIRNEYGGVGIYAGGGYSSMTNSAQVAQSFNNGSGYAGLYGGAYLPWNLKLSGAAGFVFDSTQSARNNISIGDFTGGKATANFGTSGT